MKKKDLLIVSSLRKNGRASLTSMSKAINIPVSTIYDRLKAQENNIIKRHTALIDFTKLGYNTRANIILKVKKQDREDVKEFLATHKNVNTAYKINNGYDFLVEVVFTDIRSLEDFLEQLEEKFSIQTKQVFYIVDDIKQEEFLSNPDIVKLGISSE